MKLKLETIKSMIFIWPFDNLVTKAIYIMAHIFHGTSILSKMS